MLAIRRENSLMAHEGRKNGVEQSDSSRAGTSPCDEHTRAIVHSLKSPLTSILLKISLIARIDGDSLSDQSRSYFPFSLCFGS